MEDHDIRDVVQEPSCSIRADGHPDIAYETKLAREADHRARCDRRLITQAVTNLVKNAQRGGRRR